MIYHQQHHNLNLQILYLSIILESYNILEYNYEFLMFAIKSHNVGL